MKKKMRENEGKVKKIEEKRAERRKKGPKNYGYIIRQKQGFFFLKRKRFKKLKKKGEK